MARVTLHQRVHRTADLLLGMRLRGVEERLREHGFSDATIRLGWRLIEKAACAQTEFGVERGAALRQLQQFKIVWFPVIRRVLARRDASLLAPLLGPRRVRSETRSAQQVQKLLAALQNSNLVGPEARARLRARGLTDGVLHEAQRLARAAGNEGPAASSAADLPASQELWSFYAHWARIARETITNETHLKALGLGTRTRRTTGRGPRAKGGAPLGPRRGLASLELGGARDREGLLRKESSAEHKGGGDDERSDHDA